VIFLTIRNEEVDEQRASTRRGGLHHQADQPALVLTRIRNHLTLKAASDFLRDRNSLPRERGGAPHPRAGLIQDATIVAMASLAETRDNETGNHIRRTQMYLRTLARHLQQHPRFAAELTDENIELMYKSAPCTTSARSASLTASSSSPASSPRPSSRS
jgi:putative two-component system response regulator